MKPPARALAYVPMTLVALAIGGGLGYVVYDEVTKPPSSCEIHRERVKAWEIALRVPDNLAQMDTEQALEVLDAIQKENPQGYEEWQGELEFLDGCYVDDEPVGRER